MGGAPRQQHRNALLGVWGQYGQYRSEPTLGPRPIITVGPRKRVWQTQRGSDRFGCPPGSTLLRIANSTLPGLPLWIAHCTLFVPLCLGFRSIAFPPPSPLTLIFDRPVGLFACFLI